MEPTDDTETDEHGWLSSLLDRAAMGLQTNEIEKPCEMVVTIMKSGVKDFAVAFPKGSKLRFV